MTVLWIILGTVGGGTVGFVAGMRYTRRHLATILALLSPRELAEVVKDASSIATEGQ